MKIGIVGPKERRTFWENHLRSFNSIREVVHTDQIHALGKVDACILLDTSYDDTLEALRKGYPSFLVSKLITNQQSARKIHLTSEESGVTFMISNWSVFSSVTNWMMQQIEAPDFIHIHRNIPWEKYTTAASSFRVCWTEELALSLKWIRSTIHRIDVNVLKINNDLITGLNINIRFDNSSTSNIHISLAGSDDHYTRQAGAKHQDIWCDVFNRSVRWGRLLDTDNFSYRNMDIAYKEPAQQSLALFFKAIRQGNPSSFNGHDLLRFTKAAEEVERRIKQK